MTLNKSNYMKLCEVAWDISHDGTEKQVFARYSPHVAKLELAVYFGGWEPDRFPNTVYELTEADGSKFSQECDPDDIAETLQAMVKEADA